MQLLHTLLAMLISFQFNLAPMSDQPTDEPAEVIQTEPATTPPTTVPPKGPKPRKDLPGPRPVDSTWSDIKSRFGH